MRVWLIIRLNLKIEWFQFGMNNLPDFILYIYLSVNFAGQILKTDYPSETETSGQLSATKFMQWLPHD